MTAFSLKVETYSGYRADERPLSFTLGERKFQVKEIDDRWLGPDHAYFRVLADDENRYLLKHDLEVDSWELVMMEVKGAENIT